ncbi:hypothetical protein K2X30_05520 [bacterium]|jgi:hypothetical protein|nr:hypothetical protein [bacterium]
MTQVIALLKSSYPFWIWVGLAATAGSTYFQGPKHVNFSETTGEAIRVQTLIPLTLNTSDESLD